jgi:hypothetical protein
MIIFHVFSHLLILSYCFSIEAAASAQPARPRTQEQRDNSISRLVQGLRLSESPTRPDRIDEEDMLLYHHYSWYEAIHPEEEHQNQNIRLKRLSYN